VLVYLNSLWRSLTRQAFDTKPLSRPSSRQASYRGAISESGAPKLD
jgi:hypothetical protein